MSAALTELGIGQGDIVAVGSEKRNEFVPTIFAILFTGATYTAYDLLSGGATLRHKITISQPNYFICSNRFWETYGVILKSFDCIKKFISLDDKVESVESDSIILIRTLITSNVDINKFEPMQVQGQIDTAFILYSSETTGMPTGVQLTHLNCILSSLPDDFSDESLQTAFVFGEWYHGYDIFMACKFLAMGRKVLHFNDATPKMFLECIGSCSINIAFIVPSFVHDLAKSKEVAKYNTNSLKIIYSSSSPLHKKIIDEVKLRFTNLQHILQGYGMTEAVDLTSESWTYSPKAGSVGTVSPGMTLKVVDPETRQTLGPNQRGKICLKGPVIMKGYIGINSVYLDDEGFYKTGDLGYYDDDKYFYIVGRLNEIIVYDGYKVAPLQLETILQLHPGIREAGVVGKPVPDYGEEPTAFVVKQTDYIALEVPPFMQLRGGVIFIEEMPKNSRGKIVRQSLRDMLK